jgi:hypothetical protein
MAPRRDWMFHVSDTTRGSDGWVYSVRGRRTWGYGPFRSLALAEDHQHQLFRRWSARAQRLEGWAWRKTSQQWGVVVPDGVDIPGLPMERIACTRHL